MSFEEAQNTFLLESRELLEDMEAALLRIENQPDDKDLINAIFRAAHTIKGSSGVFGFDAVEAFTHVVENVLDRARNGKLIINGEMVALLLLCRDHMAELVERAVSNSGSDAALEATDSNLRAGLERFLEASVSAVPAPVAPGRVRGTAARPVQTDTWHISLRFSADVLRNGLDPLGLLRYLARLGDLVCVTAMTDRVPALATIDPEACYLGLEIDLRSGEHRQAIEEAFDFFRDDAEIRIIEPRADVGEYIRLINELPEEDLRLGEILVRGGALTAEELEAALRFQRAEDAAHIPHERIGELLVESGLVEPQVVEAAAAKQQQSRQTQERGRNSIRVDADKLDHLINLVGELVIAGATTTLLAHRRGDEELLESNSAMGRLVEEIRDSALRLRMVQIADTFNRFQRVVRDVSQEIGKDIRLEISGGETELDKTVVEKIGDPLMHLVRNAMDHGIEAAEQRLARGKPAQGTVRLNAYHDSGSIVIEVSDDGKGLDSERILAKAREKGLVPANQQLTAQEIVRLIFEPGFSTADKVTNLSGRGVGMDVVKRNIEALRGTVDVDTTPGVGTVFSIRLPLTLAIIDGFLVRVGESSCVIPLDMVLECIEVSDRDKQDNPDARYINLRGEILPFLKLHEVFDEQTGGSGRENIVVVQYAGTKAGLVVDELLGEFQTVIKPLGKLFRSLRGVSGATILGSGDVAIILDIPQLVQAAASGSGMTARNSQLAAA